jgi:alpha-ketoglutarate-dependent taurine dioxygenase
MRIIPRPNNFGGDLEEAGDRFAAATNEIRYLRELLYEYRFVVVRNQRLSIAEFLHFATMWGSPIPHAVERLRLKGYPEVMAIGNHPIADPDGSLRNRATYWHTDKSYEQAPASFTLLYSVHAPKIGGETLFADMQAAHRGLSSELKETISGLVGLHSFAAPDDEEFAIGEAVNATPRPATARHPLVRSHPVTGKLALYGITTAFMIEGMTRSDASLLLSTLRAHVLRPEYQARHHYRVGDVMIWDNLSTLHAATPIGPATSEADTRLLYRVSVRANEL